MEFLLRDVRIISPGHPLHESRRDIHFKNGKIKRIGKSLPAKKVRTIKLPNMHISPGWVDVGTGIGEPGYEYRETLKSCSACAAGGGYTAVMPFPNTLPTVHSKTEVQFIIDQAEDLPVAFHPIGAISQLCAGKDLAELMDMKNSGAIAFSDGENNLDNTNLLVRALQYVRSFDGMVVNAPLDRSVSPEGQMHEGTISTSLGLKGIPVLAETVMLRRDLEVLAYTKSRLHSYNISSAQAIQLLSRARKEGLEVTASVAAMNLVETDESLSEFDSNYKVMPPLRSDHDRTALIKAVKKGTIDVITSNHRPFEPEAKRVEFPIARYGSTGLETCFALLRSIDMPVAIIVEKLSLRPRQIFGLDIPGFDEGSKVDFTIFDPDLDWTYESTASRSNNTPYLGRHFRGRAIGIARGKHLELHDDFK
jgi:dihydroorotase